MPESAPATRAEWLATLRPRLDPRLTEASGIVASRRHRGVYYSFNDSGHGPLLFAFDSTGSALRTWTLSGARNRDWEAAAVAACSPGSPDESCVFIGDVGDNAESRSVLQIYRVPESMLDLEGGPDTVAAARALVRYADGPRDVEAMAVTPKGTILLFTKRPKADEAGRLRESHVLAVAPMWGRPDTAVARVVDSLPIVPGTVGARQVTDASLSADGTQLVVRTYSELYLIAIDTARERTLRASSLRLCDIGPYSAPVGEGVVRVGRDSFLLMSERHNAPISLVRCQLPTP